MTSRGPRGWGADWSGSIASSSTPSSGPDVALPSRVDGTGAAAELHARGDGLGDELLGRDARVHRLHPPRQLGGDGSREDAAGAVGVARLNARCLEPERFGVLRENEVGR